MEWGCSERELLNRLSSHDLSVLEVYSRIEPFGFELQNLVQAAIRLTSIAPHVKEGYTPKIEDFLFSTTGDESGDEPAQSARITDPRTIMQIFAAIASKTVNHGNDSVT